MSRLWLACVYVQALLGHMNLLYLSTEKRLLAIGSVIYNIFMLLWWIAVAIWNRITIPQTPIFTCAITYIFENAWIWLKCVEGITMSWSCLKGGVFQEMYCDIKKLAKDHHKCNQNEQYLSFKEKLFIRIALIAGSATVLASSGYYLRLMVELTTNPLMNIETKLLYQMFYMMWVISYIAMWTNILLLSTTIHYLCHGFHHIKRYILQYLQCIFMYDIDVELWSACETWIDNCRNDHCCGSGRTGVVLVVL